MKSPPRFLRGRKVMSRGNVCHSISFLDLPLVPLQTGCVPKIQYVLWSYRRRRKTGSAVLLTRVRKLLLQLLKLLVEMGEGLCREVFHIGYGSTEQLF